MEKKNMCSLERKCGIDLNLLVVQGLRCIVGLGVDAEIMRNGIRTRYEMCSYAAIDCVRQICTHNENGFCCCCKAFEDNSIDAKLESL